MWGGKSWYWWLATSSSIVLLPSLHWWHHYFSMDVVLLLLHCTSRPILNLFHLSCISEVTELPGVAHCYSTNSIYLEVIKICNACNVVKLIMTKDWESRHWVCSAQLHVLAGFLSFYSFSSLAIFRHTIWKGIFLLLPFWVHIIEKMKWHPLMNAFPITHSQLHL